MCISAFKKEICVEKTENGKWGLVNLGKLENNKGDSNSKL